MWLNLRDVGWAKKGGHERIHVIWLYLYKVEEQEELMDDFIFYFISSSSIY